MSEHSTKYYSSRQESMVASFLGWSVVTGSGSRPFHPGDVGDEHYLGECKTSEVETDRIKIMKSHWKKISNEAMGAHKIPVLFVDNGTQKPDGTFCVTRRLNRISAESYPAIRISDSSASFSMKSAMAFLSEHDYRFAVDIFGEKLVVFTLSKFKEYLSENRW